MKAGWGQRTIRIGSRILTTRSGPQRLPHDGSCLRLCSSCVATAAASRAEPVALGGRGGGSQSGDPRIPDDRYRTKMIWLNRRDFFYHAEPDQVAKVITETKQLIHELYRRGEVDAVLPQVDHYHPRPTNPPKPFRGGLTSASSGFDNIPIRQSQRNYNA